MGSFNTDLHLRGPEHTCLKENWLTKEVKDRCLYGNPREDLADLEGSPGTMTKPGYRAQG